MVAVRMFRPALVCPAGNFYLAVDEIQPVAVTISSAGDIVDVVSWHGLMTARSNPEEFRRDLSFRGATAWLTDQDGPSVKLSVDTSGNVAVREGVPDDPSASDLGHRYVAPVLVEERETAGRASWVFRTEADENWLRYAATVRVETDGRTRVWELGRGSIAGYAVGGEGSAAVAVRRADKVPWTFRAPHELFVLARNADGDWAGERRVAEIDITDRCWPPNVIEDPLRQVHKYLDFSVRQCYDALEAGAHDIQLTVTNMERDPAVEITFSWRRFPGARFRNVDRLFDELGNYTGGFYARNMLLDECLSGTPVLSHVQADDDGYIDI
jgi:hypothetical protein